jgi:hypothetical protein
MLNTYMTYAIYEGKVSLGPLYGAKSEEDMQYLLNIINEDLKPIELKLVRNSANLMRGHNYELSK